LSSYLNKISSVLKALPLPAMPLFFVGCLPPLVEYPLYIFCIQIVLYSNIHCFCLLLRYWDRPSTPICCGFELYPDNLFTLRSNVYILHPDPSFTGKCIVFVLFIDRTFNQISTVFALLPNRPFSWILIIYLSHADVLFTRKCLVFVVHTERIFNLISFVYLL
jgi:hypothetical protein